MKKLFLMFAIVTIALVSCKKEGSECEFVEPDITATTPEIAHLQNFIAANSIPATQHPSGLFYVIHEPGAGARPGICSTVFLKYTGRLMDTNQPFDQNLNGFSTVVGGLIVGAQKGLQLFNKGGKIDLYIPPTLGYQDRVIRNQTGDTIIPANSYLKFEFELVDVQ
ncbi:MAG: peptidylprolyl isomerase [Chitinophagaceae bacterium]|nr:MAG: peptidylprolyl isomerase [Chitinophagaceae bacterium]